MCKALEDMLSDKKEEGIKEGIKEGCMLGEENMSKLMNILLENGRIDEAKRAAADKIYREKLYKENNII